MNQLIEDALIHCGYGCEPTEELLIECFYDYVDGGVFGNLTLEEAKDGIESGEITVTQIAKNLLRL